MVAALAVPCHLYPESMQPRDWRISGVDLRLVRRLATELGVSRVLAEVLVRRGLTDPEAARCFLDPGFLVRDPYRMQGMEAARRRIDAALARDEPIVVYGDYDADGITATYVLSSALRELGGTVTTRLPNRFTEGYGLSVAAVEEAAAAGARLLITVDCGIRDVEAVDWARELGIDVIVTDHHEPGDHLPDCLVLSPRVGAYPFADLAGVGVAFKLSHALFERPDRDWVEVPLRLRPLLDAVAVGTVADLVPLRDENRVLTRMGLARWQMSPRLGLVALLEVTGGTAGRVDADTLAFRIAPRLNAAGRLDDASLALSLLDADDWSEACRLARRLDECNAERRQIEAAMLQEAREMLPAEPPPAIVLDAPGWHEGVVGIVASRLAEETQRPTILLCSGEEVAKGSGRSVGNYDLLAAVTACADHLVGFGGHAAACGLRLVRSDIPAFRTAFTRQVERTLPVSVRTRSVDVDAVVAGDELTLTLADELARLAPHGHQNPRVTLLVHDAQVEAPRTSRDGRHLRCRVRVDGVCASAVHFDFPGADDLSGTRFDVPLELTVNEFGGRTSPQARIVALLPLASSDGDLCPTACDASCAERLSGEALLCEVERRRACLAGAADAGRSGPMEPPDGPHVDSDPPRRVARILAMLKNAGRLDDRRGRPLVSTLTSLLAGDERTLVLVADVGRRRPLLTRDVPLVSLGRTAAYVQGGCAAVRLPRLLGSSPLADGGTSDDADRSSAGPPTVIMAGCETAAAFPELPAACRRLIFVDPPPSDDSFCRTVAAAAHADVHLLWGEPEIGFCERVVESDYNIDRRLRSLWRALTASGGDLTAALDAELVNGPFLTKLPVLAAAIQVLSEIGLLEKAAGNDRIGKVDVGTSRTYTAWHRRYRNENRSRSFRTTTS